MEPVNNCKWKSFACRRSVIALSLKLAHPVRGCAIELQFPDAGLSKGLEASPAKVKIRQYGKRA
jgi:hypothetical protein